jgi:signal transduction histidine kinase
VTKPLNAQEVLLRVGNHLKLFVAQRRLEIQNARLREAEATARQAQEFAEAANRAKSTFLANMSHELHTPMNAIMGMAALALHRAEDPKLREQLGHIEHAAHHLLRLINDILDMTRLEAERLTLEHQAFCLDDLRPAFADAQAEATAKGLAFTLDLPAGLAAQPLAGDPARLGQILRDLVGNAVKFTAHGSIALHCARLEDHPDSVLLRFTITDTGIGIATTDQPRIFNPFVQVDASTTRAYGGTGLGLAICKRLVRLMSGDIGVESTPGAGSTFWFTVRLGKTGTSTGE